MIQKTQCKMSIVPTGLPYKRKWESVDKRTGEKIERTFLSIKATVVPSKVNENFQDIELSLNNFDSNNNGVDLLDVNNKYLDDKASLEAGKTYWEADVFLSGRSFNGNKLVTMFSPYLHGIKTINATEEDMPLLETIVNRNNRF